MRGAHCPLLLLAACGAGGPEAPAAGGGAPATTAAPVETGDTGGGSAATTTAPTTGADPCDAWSPTQRVLEATAEPDPGVAGHVRLDATLAEPGRLQVRCTTGAAPEDLHVVESPEASAHRVELVGLLPDADHACTLQPVCPAGEAVEVDLRTLPVPGDPVAVEVERAPGVEPEGVWTLATEQRVCGGYGAVRLLVLDPDGAVRWTAELPTDVFIDVAVEVLTPDEVLWGGGSSAAGVPHRLGLDGGTRWAARETGEVFHHHVESLADGDLLALVAVEETDGVATWTGAEARRLDPVTGETTWRWATAEAVAQGVLVPGAAGEDPWHVNQVTLAELGGRTWLLVSLCAAERILLVDPDTGLVEHVMGPGGDLALLDEAGAPLPDDEWMHCQHGLDVVDGRILLLDNGWDGVESRVLELAPDLAAGTVTRTWSWTEPGTWGPLLGDADPLPAERALVTVGLPECWLPAASAPQVIEVDRRDGTVAWRARWTDPDLAVYRAERLEGCELFHNARWCPELLGELTRLPERGRSRTLRRSGPPSRASR